MHCVDCVTPIELRRKGCEHKGALLGLPVQSSHRYGNWSAVVDVEDTFMAITKLLL